MRSLDLGLVSGRRIDLVTQTEVSECGLACISMVAAYHGLEIDLHGLRQRFTPPSRGMALSALAYCAEQLGFVTRALRLELEDIPALAMPAILHWSMNHFVVVERTNGDRAYIHDPAGRSRWMKLSEISRYFTGIAIELTPSNDFVPARVRHRLKLRQLWSGAPGLKSSAGQILTLSAIAQTLLLTLPYFSQLAVDRAVDQGSVQTLLTLGAAFATVVLAFGVVNYLRTQLLLATGASLGYGLSTNLARRMFRLPIAWFNNRHVGDVLARFQSLRPIRDDLTEDAIAGLIDGVFAIVTLLLIISYSPVIALVPVVFLAILGATRLFFYAYQRSAKEATIVFAGKEQSSLIEMLRGVRTLRLSGKSRFREMRWRSKLVDSINAETREKRLENSQKSIQLTLGHFENVIFLCLAFYLTISQKITIGAVFALYAYKSHFSLATVSLLEKITQIKMLSLHLDRIGDIALSKEDIRFTQHRPATRHLRGEIELLDVRYQYSDFEPEVLKGVSVKIGGGDYIAITGPSGEGKSTLAQVILGLIQPTSGEVRIDGVPLEHFGYENYQNFASAVLQDDTLFAGSILDNISLFDDAADPDQVKRFAEIADIDRDIQRMPMRYETLVGDMGAALSGGQKQRILLARALYQQPRVLVLDEGTSQLDKECEQRINLAIASLGITRIIIAHREETIRSADRILVIKDGQLTSPVAEPVQ